MVFSRTLCTNTSIFMAHNTNTSVRCRPNGLCKVLWSIKRDVEFLQQKAPNNIQTLTNSVKKSKNLLSNADKGRLNCYYDNSNAQIERDVTRPLALGRCGHSHLMEMDESGGHCTSVVKVCGNESSL